MPYLEITECISCPFVYTSSKDDNGEQVGEDMFYVKCKHGDQHHDEGFIAKIKNKDNHIYFNCPL